MLPILDAHRKSLGCSATLLFPGVGGGFVLGSALQGLQGCTWGLSLTGYSTGPYIVAPFAPKNQGKLPR